MAMLYQKLVIVRRVKMRLNCMLNKIFCRNCKNMTIWKPRQYDNQNHGMYSSEVKKQMYLMS